VAVVAAHAARCAPCAVRARSARGRAPCWSAGLADLSRCLRCRHQPGLHRPVCQVRAAAGVALRAVGLPARMGLLLGARQRPGGPLRRLAQRLADRCGAPRARPRARAPLAALRCTVRCPCAAAGARVRGGCSKARLGRGTPGPGEPLLGRRCRAAESSAPGELARGRAGRYFVGVNGDDAHNCSFTLSITKYSCPLNCSGRGTCQHLANGTRTCLCDKARGPRPPAAPGALPRPRRAPQSAWDWG